MWRGSTPIPGSAEAVARLRDAGWRVVFTTNNSSLRIADYVERLRAVGIVAAPDDVCTSAQAAARLLGGMLRPGAAVLVCGGPGVVEALEAAGLAPIDAGPADAVVVGFHRDFDFDGLTVASDAARAGGVFVATNLDPTYPVDGGLVPGAGAVAAAVSTAAGRSPLVAGKPERPMAELVRARFGDDGIVVGDRPSTDGAFAAALGWPFGLVLSGVAGAPGGEPVPEPRPAFVAADLAQLTLSILRGP